MSLSEEYSIVNYCWIFNCENEESLHNMRNKNRNFTTIIRYIPPPPPPPKKSKNLMQFKCKPSSCHAARKNNNKIHFHKDRNR